MVWRLPERWLCVRRAGRRNRSRSCIPHHRSNEPTPGVDSNDGFELPYEYRRQAVFYRTTEAPGTIIVNTHDRFLYLVQGNNRAIRYGVGVGRDGFQWGGVHTHHPQGRNGRTGRRRRK